MPIGPAGGNIEPVRTWTISALDARIDAALEAPTSGSN
jgi:hypothetical protein